LRLEKKWNEKEKRLQYEFRFPSRSAPIALKKASGVTRGRSPKESNIFQERRKKMFDMEKELNWLLDFLDNDDLEEAEEEARRQRAMAKARREHPTTEVLYKCWNGQTGGEEDLTIRIHVDLCPCCRMKLDEFSRREPLDESWHGRYIVWNGQPVDYEF